MHGGNFRPLGRLARVAFDDITPQGEKTNAAMARAFDVAWDRFLQIEGDEADTDENRGRLAARIVALARSGEIGERELGEAGLIHLRVLAAAARIGAGNRHEMAFGTDDRPDRQGGHAFTPETIAAMSTALDLCLDELPFRIPSDALKLLSTSILDAASRGERAPDRLRLHALNALKARQ